LLDARDTKMEGMIAYGDALIVGNINYRKEGRGKYKDEADPGASQFCSALP